MILIESQEGIESCSFVGFVGKKVIQDQSKPQVLKVKTNAHMKELSLQGTKIVNLASTNRGSSI